MNNLDYDFILQDRVAKIQAINEQYDLENNYYISFSGGKDSTILHYLMDVALPNNNIPRVFINTGIEFTDVVKFVKELAKNDKRIIIFNNTNNIPRTLSKYGYPFKSKEYSKLFHTYTNMHNKGLEVCENYLKVINGTGFNSIPKILKYQFDNYNNFNYSDYCCTKFKKDNLHKAEKIINRFSTITGIRKDEGGRRATLSSCITAKGKKFHPLIVVNEEWEDEFIKRNNIQLCKLYYPPYNFKRTGCKGCPFAIEIEKHLLMMKKYLPSDYKQCLHLWSYVYKEYARIGYRIKDEELKKEILNYGK